MLFYCCSRVLANSKTYQVSFWRQQSEFTDYIKATHDLQISGLVLHVNRRLRLSNHGLLQGGVLLGLPAAFGTWDCSLKLQ